jgi:hypothetical protein
LNESGSHFRLNHIKMRNAWLFPLTHWNWKAALITAICRAGACMAALWHSPLYTREHFGAVEAAYVLLTAGIFSAWQQQALDVKPRKLGWVVTVLAIPLGSLAGDSALHLWLDNGDMKALGISALIVTVASAMFHWHIMRNGAMLVGESSRSFMDDMKAMPRLLVTFFTEPYQAIMNRIRADRATGEAGKMEIAA